MPPIRTYNPELSLLENWRELEAFEFSAWQFASEEQRNEYRDAGQSEQRTEWLRQQLESQLVDAIAAEDLLALAIEAGDAASQVLQIPLSVFRSGSLKIDYWNSTVSALERRFLDVRICRAIEAPGKPSKQCAKQGRPSSLDLFVEAWADLKATEANFLQWSKTNQNDELCRKVGKMNPGKFPSNHLPGVSTIRRHRREHSDLFD